MTQESQSKLMFEFPFVPPSANHLYFNLPTGGRGLSKEAKTYKEKVKNLLIEKYYEKITNFSPDKYKVFKVTSIIYLDNVLTKSKDAKSPYRKIDVDNRLKAFNDAVFESLGIGDHRIFDIISKKREGSPKTVMVIETLNYDELEN